VDKFAKLPGRVGRKIEGFMSDEITNDPYVTISLYSFLLYIKRVQSSTIYIGATKSKNQNYVLNINIFKKCDFSCET
jgi:hypothetical protein